MYQRSLLLLLKFIYKYAFIPLLRIAMARENKEYVLLNDKSEIQFGGTAITKQYF